MSTDIRYRNNVAVAKAEVTIDATMDISVANSTVCGDPVGNLNETLEQIVEGNDIVPVPEEDMSLSDVMVLISESEEVKKVEFEVPISEVELEVAVGEVGKIMSEVPISEVDKVEPKVADDDVGVKCESDDKKESTEAPDGGKVAQSDCSGVNDNVITIDNPVEVVNTTECPSASGNVNSNASSGAKIGPVNSGGTLSPIQTIPKYRLREIFRHANGNIYKLSCVYPVPKVRESAGFAPVIAVLLSI